MALGWGAGQFRADEQPLSADELNLRAAEAELRAQEEQLRADEASAQAEARYEQMQRLMELFEEPIRRAEAAMRLEAWLATHPAPPRDSSGGPFA